MKKAKFPLGRVAYTPGALAKLDRPKIAELLRRHGQLDKGTRLRTSKIREGFRILSSFAVDGGDIWVITEGDRSATTVLLPE